jgi:regulator of sigma E protease
MFILTLIIFILVIGLLVLVHELGHYVAARSVGIKVEEFAVGMGPKIWGWVKSGIEYNIRALPIGGYVRMYGEGDYNVKDENSFGGKKPSLRLIVLVAGVFMNFVLATFLFYVQGVHQDFRYRNIEGVLDADYQPWFGEKTHPYIAISDVSDNSPLKGKIEDFDIITKLNGEDYTVDSFRQTIKESKGKDITLELTGYTTNNPRQITVQPIENEKGEGVLGIRLGLISFLEYKGTDKLWAGFGQSFNSIKTLGASVGYLVQQSFKTNSIVPVADSFGGAIGIFDILGKIITSFGFWGVLELMALFSINLALFNILPIPALDGGHVLFTLLEMIFRRKLPNAIYNYLTIGGFVLLIGFMLAITSLDLVKYTNIRNVFCSDGRKVGFLCDLSDFRE